MMPLMTGFDPLIVNCNKKGPMGSAPYFLKQVGCGCTDITAIDIK